ncbi:MAG: hypothetical protein NTV34_13955 [Proteobacteria bacterium]|nr:hypothetical protein [Pseudomonadota bacterium]
MNREIENWKAMGRRYKKWILIAAVSGLVALTLGIGTLGFVAYQALSITSEKIKSSQLGNVSYDVSLPKPGFIEDVMLGVATGWLKQSLVSAEVVSFKNGLACFDAVGGPKPLVVLDYLKARVTDEEVTKGLDSIANSLKSSSIPASEPAACANWILSS